MNRSLKTLALGAAVALSATMIPSQAHAYGFSPWTTQTGEKTLVINPFVYTTFGTSFGLADDAVIWYGITKDIDVAVNLASTTILSPFAYTGSWIMPRVQVAPNLMVNLKLGLAGSAFYVAPEVDWLIYPEKSPFGLEINVSGTYTFGGSFALAGTFTPLYKFSDNIAAFLEINPSLALTSPAVFGLGFNPGVAFNFGKDNVDQLIFAFTGTALSGSTFAVTPGVGIQGFFPIAL